MSLCFHHSFNYLIEDKGKMKNFLEFCQRIHQKIGCGYNSCKVTKPIQLLSSFVNEYYPFNEKEVVYTDDV